MEEKLKNEIEINNEINTSTKNQNESDKLIKNEEEEEKEDEKIENDKVKDEYIKKQIELCKQLKKEGDEYLKSFQFSKATNTYTKAVINVKYLKKEKLITRLVRRDLEKEVLIPSNLNMAYIDIQNKNWSECIRHSSKVLFVDENNVKARYRRCFGYIKSNNLEKADEDLIVLEDQIGGSADLEELEELFENCKKKTKDSNNNNNNNTRNNNKNNSRDDDGFLRKMGKNLKNNFNGPINQPEVTMPKKPEQKRGVCTKLKAILDNIINQCFKKKNLKKEIKKKQ
jgi:hypothetical protein